MIRIYTTRHLIITRILVWYLLSPQLDRKNYSRVRSMKIRHRNIARSRIVSGRDFLAEMPRSPLLLTVFEFSYLWQFPHFRLRDRCYWRFPQHSHNCRWDASRISIYDLNISKKCGHLIFNARCLKWLIFYSIFYRDVIIIFIICIKNNYF